MSTDQQPVSATGKVPVEIWLDILELVPSSADLYSVSVTCRRFHDLTLRALHRNLVWTKPVHVARSLPLWDLHPGMDAGVRSLQLGISTVNPGSLVPMVGLSGEREPISSEAPRFNQNGPYGRETLVHYDLCNESRGGFASPALHDAMFARINTFRNISSLTFTNMLIYDMHFALIHSLPLLRSLRLELCIFSSMRAGPMPVEPTEFNHRNLPITELTMLNLRRRVVDFAFQQMLYDENLTDVLSLCTARNLRTLTVDSTADVFRYIYGVFDAQARGWRIPASLAHVYVLRRRQFHGEVQPLYRGENNFPESHLYHFAVQAPGLRTLSTPLFVPQNVTIAPEALPLGLERFAAPVESATAVAAARDLQALGVLKCGLGSREAINALESIAAYRPGLKMLLMELRGWEDEIIPAVVDLFKGIRRLKIVWEGDECPSEDFMVMLGPQFLARLPELHTVELYPQPGPVGLKPQYPRMLFDDSFESIEEELLNLVIPYSRHCPKLRKVQLCAGFVVSRGCDGARWTVERIRRLEEKDDLSY